MPVDPAGTAQFETTREFMRTLLALFCDSVESLGIILFGERGNAIEFYADHIRPLVDAAVRASEATWQRWPHRDYDIRTAMNAAFGMAYWHALDRAIGGEPTQVPDADALADQLADILWRGISDPR